jgi:hypothetical protein
MQASRLEEDHEGFDCTGKSQPDPAMSLETHDLHTLAGLNERPVTPVNFIGVAKLKFKERGSPGWNWVVEGGVSYVPCQMRIRANVRGQSWGSSG